MSKRNYLSNKEILPEIIEYKRTGVASEKFGEIILMIANRLSQKPNFIGYTWREDMVSEATLTCLRYAKNFDPSESNNPFSYLTTICYNAFRAYLNKQDIHSTIKDECYNKVFMLKDDPYTAINYEEMKEANRKKKKKSTKKDTK